MRTVDLSHVLDNTTLPYPGDPKYSCCPGLTIEKDGVNVLSISLGSHTGTHVDAPYHFLPEGRTIEHIPLSEFIGPAIVIDLTERKPRERIMWKDLAQYEKRMHAGAKNGAMVLLRTGWSKYWNTDMYYAHPFFDKKVAQKIMDTGIGLIGVDTFSPDETILEPEDGAQLDYGVHRVVLGSDALIAENLSNLSAIQEGEWVVSLVPLKLGGSDGSPVRAHAWRKDEV